jgi:arylsulfatase A-like enzyme
MLQRGVEKTHAGTAGLLRGAKGTTYEGGFRVPAIIRWPGNIPAGQVSPELVTTMDVFATLVEIAGAALPDDRKIDGSNAYPLMKGENHISSEPFFYCRGETLQAVRKGKWKLRVTGASGIELYNMDLDPSEMYNVAEDNQGPVEELYQELVRFSEETDAMLESVEK